jgi:hypothetical protein
MTNRPEPKKRPKHSSSPIVDVVPLVPTDAIITIASQGIVRPRLRTELVCQVSGRIVEVADNLRDGAAFQKGDLLVKLESTDYEIAVAAAEAKISKEQLQVAELKLQEKRALSNVAIAEAESPVPGGVDTPDDLQRVIEIFSD